MCFTISKVENIFYSARNESFVSLLSAEWKISIKLKSGMMADINYAHSGVFFAVKEETRMSKKTLNLLLI